MHKSAKSWLGQAPVGLALVVLLQGAACTGVIGESTADPEIFGPPGGGGNNATGGNSSGGTGGGPVGSQGGIGGTGGGGTGGKGGTGGTVFSGEPVYAAPALRRLTSKQFSNTMAALLGNVQTLGIEGEPRGGDTSMVAASIAATTPRGVEMYETAITNALSQVFFDQARRSAFIGCTPAAGPADGCTRMFIERFGQRAWRRPLTQDEITRHAAVATLAANALGDPNAGPRWAATSLLQSPNFLYRPEIGKPDPKDTKRRRLTGWEVASRLSYFLTNNPPDELLMQAAGAGELDGVDGLAAQAQRLVATPKAQKAMSEFAADLLYLDAVATIPKDAKLFPKFTDTIRQAFTAEIERMWSVAFTGGSALDLFTSRTRYVTKDLATYYGLSPTTVSATTPTAITIPDTNPRVGLLGSGGLMALYAGQVRSSPTLRGKFVREVLLCQEVPAPPPNVGNFPDPPAGVVWSNRQRLEAHMTNPTCAACHAFTDKPGFAMENFDAVGAYRTKESGLDIDPSGNLDGAAYADLPGFAQAVVDKGAPRCLARHFVESSMGRRLVGGQEPLVDALAMRFSAGGYKLGTLLTDLVATDAFRYVAAGGIP